MPGKLVGPDTGLNLKIHLSSLIQMLQQEKTGMAVNTE